MEKKKRIRLKQSFRSHEYIVWFNMKSRCGNPKNAAYMNYGGRGITVSENWTSFKQFLADMGPCPAGMSLDRRNNNAGYSRENCAWASAHDQARNKRNTRLLVVAGETKSLPEWASIYGIKINTIASRLHYGWPQDLAVTSPVSGRPLRALLEVNPDPKKVRQLEATRRYQAKQRAINPNFRATKKAVHA